jgi:hypothetical protein
VSTTDLWHEDERVRRFFDLIASELSDADEAITRNLRVARLLAFPRAGEPNDNGR